MILQLFRSRGIFLEPEIMSPAECDSFCQEALGSGTHVDATIYDGANVTLDEKSRRTKVVRISESGRSRLREVFSQIQPRLEDHFQVRLQRFDQPQVLVYRKGDHFSPHQDAPEQNQPGYDEDIQQRKVSATLLLNNQGDGKDCYEGGAFTFYGLMADARAAHVGIPLPSAAGLLVAFRPQVIHAVEPVTRGHRISVVTFFS